MLEIYMEKFDLSISCSFPPKANGKADIQWANIVPALWWDVQHLSRMQNVLQIRSSGE